MEGMEKHDRDFKGVWIPKEIWLSENLSLMEKVLFVEIHSLDNEHGCFATNKYFARFFGVGIRQIIRYINSLEEKGYITVTMQGPSNRTIRTTGKFRKIQKSEIGRLNKQKAELVSKFRI
jgi:hypothetical protein